MLFSVIKTHRQRAVEGLIRSYLLDLRRHCGRSQLRHPHGLAYHWNEREFQWDLFQYMRKQARGHGLGSPYWVRAEVVLKRSRWAREPGSPRPDIGVVDHGVLREHYRKLAAKVTTEFPVYESLIELKVVWHGAGPAAHRAGFLFDLRKLQRAILEKDTRSAYFVILDNLSRNGRPYFSPASLQRMKKRWTRVGIFHWPDGDEPSSSGKFGVRLY